MRQLTVIGCRINTIVLGMSLIAFGGCNEAIPDKEALEMNVIGKWQTPSDPKETLETEYGPARMFLEFKETGILSMRLEVLSGPGGSGNIDDKKPYKFRGDMLISDAIDRGEEVAARINNDGHLILQLQNGELYDFVKVL